MKQPSSAVRIPSTIQAEFKLFGVIKRKGGWYVAPCPPLDVTTQGRTRQEAERNLKEACALFLTSCFERGTFEQALRELGWSVSTDGARAPKSASAKIPEGAFQFPIPIPFALQDTSEWHV